MLIRNPALAGQTVRFRHSPDPVTGDEQGTFEVSDKDGQLMADSPGWEVVKAPPPLPPAPPLPPPPPSAAETEPPPEEEEEDWEEDEEEEEEEQ